MKVAVFWDSAINIDSYYVKDGEAYSYWTDKPYNFHHSISSKLLKFCEIPAKFHENLGENDHL